MIICYKTAFFIVSLSVLFCLTKHETDPVMVFAAPCLTLPVTACTCNGNFHPSLVIPPATQPAAYGLTQFTSTNHPSCSTTPQTVLDHLYLMSDLSVFIPVLTTCYILDLPGLALVILSAALSASCSHPGNLTCLLDSTTTFLSSQKPNSHKFCPSYPTCFLSETKNLIIPTQPTCHLSLVTSSRHTSVPVPGGACLLWSYS